MAAAPRFRASASVDGGQDGFDLPVTAGTTVGVLALSSITMGFIFVNRTRRKRGPHWAWMSEMTRVLRESEGYSHRIATLETATDIEATAVELDALAGRLEELRRGIQLQRGVGRPDATAISDQLSLLARSGSALAGNLADVASLVITDPDSLNSDGSTVVPTQWRRDGDVFADLARSLLPRVKECAAGWP